MTEIKEVPFETLLDKLQKTVKQLESGELGLEASLAAYEQGIAFVRTAQAKLDSMTGKIEELMADGNKKS